MHETQPSLLDLPLRPPRFDGPGLTDSDVKRLSGQLERIKALMADGLWRTLAEICEGIGATSEAGASARLRDLRKARFGAYTVESRRREGTLFEYRVL